MLFLCTFFELSIHLSLQFNEKNKELWKETPNQANEVQQKNKRKKPCKYFKLYLQIE
jgi:hypothetical protein